LKRTAINVGLLFAMFSGFTAYHSIDPQILALPDHSPQVILFVSIAVVLSVAEVAAAFWLVWLIRRRIGSPKKAPPGTK
jgi:hypothetical protein